MKKILLKPALRDFNLSEFKLFYRNDRRIKRKLQSKATLQLTVQSENIQGEKTYSCTFEFCNKKEEPLGTIETEESISFADHTPGFQFTDSTPSMLSRCKMEKLLVHMIHQTGQIQIVENRLTLISSLLSSGEVSVELPHTLLEKLLA